MLRAEASKTATTTDNRFGITTNTVSFSCTLTLVKTGNNYHSRGPAIQQRIIAIEYHIPV